MKILVTESLKTSDLVEAGDVVRLEEVVVEGEEDNYSIKTPLSASNVTSSDIFSINVLTGKRKQIMLRLRKKKRFY